MWVRENLRLYCMCASLCVRLFVCVLLHVCVFLNLTCVVLPELVTSGTSDSDSCSCKSGPLSLAFFFSSFLHCLSFLSSSFFLACLLSATVLLRICGFVFTHAHMKLCLGFCPPLCTCVHVCACVLMGFPIMFVCLSSISRVDGDWSGCPFDNSPSQSETQSCLFVPTVGQEEAFLTYQPVMQQEGQSLV